MACKIWQIAAQTHFQMMGYVIQTPENKLLMIDGGWPGDADYLMHLLRKIGGKKPHVDAWFLTHPHSDHVTALYHILQERSDELSIGSLYHHYPARDLLVRGEPGCVKVWDAHQELRPQFKDIEYILEEGQELQFDSVRFEVLYVSDPGFVRNTSNNSSVVLKMTAEGKSVMFLGDLGVEGGEKLLAMHKAEKLKSDIVQMAHHGQSAVKMDVYDAIRPEICLWSAPKWLYYNNQGCRGYDSGEWDILHVRAHMKKLGVRSHIVGKDGTALLTIDNGQVTITCEDPYWFD